MTGPNIHDFAAQGQEVVPASPQTGAGRFNPYRGADVHGVASPDVWQDVQAPTPDSLVVPVHVEPPEQEPVPVRIVHESGAQELRTHRISTVPIKPLAEVTQVVGRHRARIMLRIVNSGTVLVSVVNDRAYSGINSYPLPVGGPFQDFPDDDVLYMVNDGSATMGQVSIIEFYTVSQ